MKRKSEKILAIFIIFAIVIFSNITNASTVYNRDLSYYPSYLLLGNWVNTSFLVITGIPIPNATLNGFENSNASIKNIYYGSFGILPYEIQFNIFPAYYSALNLNNTITIEGKNGQIEILSPQGMNSILMLIFPNKKIISSIYIPSNYSINIYSNEAIVNNNPSIYIFFNGTYKLISSNSQKILQVSYSNNGYLEFSINDSKFYSPSYLISYNLNQVNNWLYKSSKVKNTQISNKLVSDYYLSLLLIKDDQNPVTGEFAASPSPIYLYNWLRDSSFAAIALQESGHINSAYKFWIWESNSTQIKDGLWYTRYNFYNGQPDTNFGIPEFDSIGLFEIGVYEYFQITHNYSFLTSILPSLNKTLTYEINEINRNEFHLLPEDLSVWESNLAYNFWTQSIDDIGLYDSSLIYQYLGINNSLIKVAASELNESIMKYFWNGKYFYPSLTPSVIYENNTKIVTLMPSYSNFDSSTILPIDLGFIDPSSQIAYSDVNQEIAHLTVLGGLSRFTNDNYHYSQYLYDSSSLNPPWDITTLFLSYYYELIGNISGSISLLNWVYTHSQNGLLPEAVDPNYGNPLPTTSPLTWSAAMYVITINNLPSNNSNKIDTVITWIILIALLIIISYAMEKRSVLKK
ncbi:glycoside hydrolase family 15 protein [Caldisphaera sp.]|uniref:glycoside hydrolase family 15 protein n=1 Tax=Caldisphaera sp. TaxID=2060322 RepID=UPI0025B7DC1B|nr:glycoside hydrolase family 15 protein [Caldisphaera sp.]